MIKQDDFVRNFMIVYRNGGTIADLSIQTKMSINSASVKASNMRKRGVELPFLNKRKGNRGFQVEYLNSIIDEYDTGTRATRRNKK